MIRIIHVFRVFVGLFLFLCMAGQPGRAQLVVNENFDSGKDSNWVHYNPLGVGAYKVSLRTYHIHAKAPANEDGGPGRAGSSLSGVTATDFRISVDLVGWDATLQQSFGIIARATEIGLGTSDGYFLSYSPGESSDRANAYLTIERLDNEVPTAGNSSDPISPDINPKFDYRMVFEGIGDTFTGSIYALSDLETPVATVSFTDSTYSSGAVGLLVTDSSVVTPSSDPLNPADATFDNFSFTAVPEPTTGAIFIGASAFVFAVARRRFRRA